MQLAGIDMCLEAGAGEVAMVLVGNEVTSSPVSGVWGWTGRRLRLGLGLGGGTEGILITVT